jgi:uncharacterized protein YktA (UPF0223 family)
MCQKTGKKFTCSKFVKFKQKLEMQENIGQQDYHTVVMNTVTSLPISASFNNEEKNEVISFFLEISRYFGKIHHWAKLGYPSSNWKWSSSQTISIKSFNRFAESSGLLRTKRVFLRNNMRVWGPMTSFTSPGLKDH